MKKPTLLFLLLALSGCGLLGSEEHDLRLQVAGSAFKPGQTVDLTLTNFTHRTYIVHPELCDALLERQEDNAWVDADPGRICTQIGYTLKPGGVVHGKRDLKGSLESGRYRFAYGLSRDGQSFTVYSKAFDIVRL